MRRRSSRALAIVWKCCGAYLEVLWRVGAGCRAHDAHAPGNLDRGIVLAFEEREQAFVQRRKLFSEYAAAVD